MDAIHMFQQIYVTDIVVNVMFLKIEIVDDS